ncbi:hypothetical protein HLB23_22370 [Nocardia uniformis]|uniref:Uncharacterized protein n=1 Tax=Nocardia uniformis TaxID=53432 RepID=A0A849CGI4_9NOCA|nr:hypothetical protein [Nocardia uniformis]NNH72571.1 hypothetical protein [Nocardia uniformis]
MTGSVMLIFDCTVDPGDLAPDLAYEVLQIHLCCADRECRARSRAERTLTALGRPRPTGH